MCRRLYASTMPCPGAGSCLKDTPNSFSFFWGALFQNPTVPVKQKNPPAISGLLYTHYISILLLFDYSLRLAPSVTGVAVASLILCISTTLNKRKYKLIYLSLYGIISLSYPPVKRFFKQKQGYGTSASRSFIHDFSLLLI